MKKFNIFLLLLVAMQSHAQTQVGANQIKKDNVTVVGNNNNALAVGTFITNLIATKVDSVVKGTGDSICTWKAGVKKCFYYPSGVTTAVDTIFKNVTRDSIVYTINGKRHAVKDSIGTTDTLSLSNRINHKVDTIYRTTGKDSIQFLIDGRYHAILDSTEHTDTNSLSNRINTKLAIADTTGHWQPVGNYFLKSDTASRTPDTRFARDSAIAANSSTGYPIVNITLAAMQALAVAHTVDTNKRYRIVDAFGGLMNLLAAPFNDSTLNRNATAIFKNGAMSTAVKVAVVYDLATDKPNYIYEPTHNNLVRTNKVYTILPLFRFDDATQYNNEFDDFGVTNYGTGITYVGCKFSDVVINFNSTNTHDFQNQHISGARVINPHTQVEVRITGDNTHWACNDFWGEDNGAIIQNVSNSDIEYNTIGWFCIVDCENHINVDINSNNWDNNTLFNAKADNINIWNNNFKNNVTVEAVGDVKLCNLSSGTLSNFQGQSTTAINTTHTGLNLICNESTLQDCGVTGTPAGGGTIENCNLQKSTVNFNSKTGCLLCNCILVNTTITFTANNQTICNQAWLNNVQVLQWSDTSGRDVDTKFARDSAIAANVTGWSLTGNNGTNPITNFVGTADAEPLMFRDNNVASGQLNSTDNLVFFGATAGTSNSGQYVVGVGNQASNSNTGTSVVGIGRAASESNTGDKVVGIGESACQNNSGTEVVGAGSFAARGNTGSSVIAVGETAAQSNAFDSVIALGNSAIPTAGNQLYISDMCTTAVMKFNGSNPNDVLTSDGAGNVSWQPTSIFDTTLCLNSTHVHSIIACSTLPIHADGIEVTDLTGVGIFHIAKGEGGHMPFPYETTVIENSGDHKFGIYTSEPYFAGNGSSIVLGEDSAYNVNSLHPGFEIQNVNDSATPGNSVMRVNYLERAQDGTVAGATTDIFDIYGDGRVAINGFFIGTMAYQLTSSYNTNTTTQPLLYGGTGANLSGTGGTSQVLRQSTLGATISVGQLSFSDIASQASLTAQVSGILPAANGGTGNGFTAFSGATTSTKTYTLPNASTTILTTNTAVTAAQGGTGQTSYTTNDILYASGTTTLSKLGTNSTATNKFLRTVSSGAPSYAQVAEADLSLTDITTNNSTTSLHGLLKKLDNTATNYMDGSGNWSVPAGSGANAALSNLASVSINTSLLAQTGVDLGSTTKPFRDLYLFGAGTFATTYIKVTGTPTSTRTATLPDNTGTIAETNLNNSFSTNQSVSGNVAVSTQLILGNSISGSQVYRTTNGGSNIIPLFFGNAASSSAGILSMNYDATNQLTLSHGNGTRQMAGVSIQGLGANNVAGSESMRMGLFTTSAGAALAERVSIDSLGRVGLGNTTPAAWLDIQAGTTAAGKATAHFATGVSGQTAKVAGNFNYDGTDLYLEDATYDYTIDKALVGTATLDFASLVSIGCEDLTITVTGATLSDPVILGVPNASVVANGNFTAWVSATNTVTVRFCTLVTGDPASGSFKVRVIR